MPTGERPVTSGRASEELFAELLHDIRTPLSIISGRARLLQRRLYANLHGCDVIADISQIEDAAVRLAHLVDDLSQFQTFGRLVLSYETVDLNELVQQVAESCTDPTEDSRIVVLAGPSPLVALWDRAKIQRVFTNVVTNALKYSSEQTTVIAVVAEENGSAIVRVADHGTGISAADMRHLFEPFYRGKNAVGAFPGTGLGLASARRLVQEHGGTIEIETEEGIGTTVTVRLPLALPYAIGP